MGPYESLKYQMPNLAKEGSSQKFAFQAHVMAQSKIDSKTKPLAIFFKQDTESKQSIIIGPTSDALNFDTSGLNILVIFINK